MIEKVEKDKLILIIGICLWAITIIGTFLFSIWFYGDLITYINAEKESFNVVIFLVGIIIVIVFYVIVLAIIVIAIYQRRHKKRCEKD